MPELIFYHGIKREIPRKYLEQVITLMQHNGQELMQSPPPDAEFYRRQWILSHPSSSRVLWVIAVNERDEVVSYGYLKWNVKYDNLDKGYCYFYVKKTARRRGIGTSMMKKIVPLFPEQITTIVTEAFSTTPAKEFLSRLKEKESFTEIISVANLTEFNFEEVATEAKRQRELAREKGYEIIYINNLDHIFHVDLEEFVAMVETIWKDMPQEELSYEDERLTIDRFLEMNQRSMFLGYRLMTFVAIHKESDKLVGLTNTIINKYNPTVAIQDDTGLLREHRGNGLGLAMKYQMLEKLLKETDAKIWRTGNAGSNEHMLRINRKLKYKPIITLRLYEFSRKELQEKLGKL